MSLHRVMVLLLIPAASLPAQLASNTVTVTASRSFTVQPDVAVFTVAVTSGTITTLDEVVGALSGLGVTPANLVSVGWRPLGCFALTSAPRCPPSNLQWTFRLTVPFTRLKDTTAALTSLQKSVPQNNSWLTLSFSLSGTGVSGQQAPSCNLADLVAQARAQAQQIASAAGLNAGAVVGLTSATSTAAPPACSLTVRFALGAMFEQPGPNSITITATRANNIQPDQALVVLSVTSGTTAGLDDITAALTGAGISGTSFTGVYTTTINPSSGSQTPRDALAWSFTLTAPLAKLSDTLALVLSSEQAISGNNSGLTLTFYVAGMQVSQQLRQSQPCSQAALLTDAQVQAKQVATAAGVSAGPILSTAAGGCAVLAQVAPSLGRCRDPCKSRRSIIFPKMFNLTCSLTVQFQLM